MNISTLAKILGVTTNQLRESGQKNGLYGFAGRNTRIPYNSALEVTKILRPDKVSKLQNDDRVYLPASVTVGEFAEAVGKPSGVVLKTLLMNGVMATLNERIDYDTASLIAEEMGIPIYPESEGTIAESDNAGSLNMIKTLEYDTPEENKEYITRPPVVTVMGHVDHGKTTLLDTIRKTNVVATEAGAITQHISSYQIVYNNQKITFVDTPGHEAFTAMRARGTQLADFIILMVSAVEGPKPQTVEVIERAKLAKVPIIVAINKVDLPDADIERAKNEIAAFGLVPEEWGGETPFIPVSAKVGTNVNKVLDTILLHAEVVDLKGQVNCAGQALVIESHLDRAQGVITTALVVKDKIAVGNIIRCSEYVSKIRKLQTTEGKNIQEAKIGQPVLLFGLPEVMSIGEPIVVYKDQKQAHTDASTEKLKRANKRVAVNGQAQTKGNQINVLLKADVSGSLEAIKEAIIKIPQDKVKVIIKQESIGEVSEGDLEFANTAESTILAFHTRLSAKAEHLLKRTPVNIVQSDIIYELLNWVEEQILARTEREIKITTFGQCEVLAIFKSDKPTIQILGCEVKNGKIFDNKPLRVLRGEAEIGRVEINEMQRNKSKTSEVNVSQQFGLSVSGRCKVQIGDTLESIDETIVK